MVDFLDKRKNFRFPAFADDEGVKLPKQSTRKLFADEYESVFQSDRQKMPETTEETYAEKYYPEQFVSTPPELTPLREIATRKHRAKTPVAKEKQSRVVEKPVFHSEYQPSVAKKNRPETPSGVATETRYTTASSKRFTPKHIPPSYRPEETEGSIDGEQLFKQMTKPKNSYLLMATEPDSQETGKAERNRTSHFKHRQNEATSEAAAVEQLELVGAKEVETTASGTHRLEKSLSGIMEEEEKQFKKNKYFSE